MSFSVRLTLGPLAALVLACAAQPSHALFKVVGPDGSVTYTDRPPPAEIGKPSANKSPAAAPDTATALASLPLELRQVAQRFPVTLFTSNECAPCESARRLLKSRGVPYSERRVATEDDAEALNRLTGGRSVPTVMIGSQALRGYAEGDWHSYLDAAGYPRESRLPASYQQPAPTPLVERKPEVAAPAAAAPPPEPVAPPPTTAPSPTGIRF